MKKIILVLGISFACISQTKAATTFNCTYQTPTNDEKVTKMTELLQLTADQQKKYKALLVSTEKAKDELKEKLKTASKEDKKKLQDEFKANYESELIKILTPSQFKKLKEEASKKK